MHLQIYKPFFNIALDFVLKVRSKDRYIMPLGLTLHITWKDEANNQIYGQLQLLIDDNNNNNIDHEYNDDNNNNNNNIDS